MAKERKGPFSAVLVMPLHHHLDHVCVCRACAQNLETAETSRHYVTLLLEASLEDCRWKLAKELTRFLRAIGELNELDLVLERVAGGGATLKPATL